MTDHLLHLPLNSFRFAFTTIVYSFRWFVGFTHNWSGFLASVRMATLWITWTMATFAIMDALRCPLPVHAALIIPAKTKAGAFLGKFNLLIHSANENPNF